MYMNQQDAQNSSIRCHTTVRRMGPAYTKCNIQLIKAAPDDVLIQSETCKASNRKIKTNHKNFVHLVGSYTNRYVDC